MAHRLSEREKRRISEFVATPKYDRDPEMLVPDDED
jgi:hypothetical protein